MWFGAGQAEPTNWMIAWCATIKGEKGSSGIVQVLNCFFSVGNFSVHSRPLTPESAATATSMVKLPMLQSEGDKMKYSLEWQYQETAETSHDRGCAR